MRHTRKASRKNDGSKRIFLHTASILTKSTPPRLMQWPTTKRMAESAKGSNIGVQALSSHIAIEMSSVQARPSSATHLPVPPTLVLGCEEEPLLMVWNESNQAYFNALRSTGAIQKMYRTNGVRDLTGRWEWSHDGVIQNGWVDLKDDATYTKSWTSTCLFGAMSWRIEVLALTQTPTHYYCDGTHRGTALRAMAGASVDAHQNLRVSLKDNSPGSCADRRASACVEVSSTCLRHAYSWHGTCSYSADGFELGVESYLDADGLECRTCYSVASDTDATRPPAWEYSCPACIPSGPLTETKRS